MPSKNTLRDGVIAGFWLVSIDKKEFETKITDGSGGVKTIPAFKFVAKFRHDQTTSKEDDYADVRDPDGSLELSAYMWGYMSNGKPVLQQKRAPGLDYGACFLTPEKWREMLSTAKYVAGEKKATGIVFWKVRLTQTANFLTHEFGDKEFQKKKDEAINEMYSMLNAASKESNNVTPSDPTFPTEENGSDKEEKKKAATRQTKKKK